MSVLFGSHGKAFQRPSANTGDYLITGKNRLIPGKAASKHMVGLPQGSG
jgi:hypothetical protein